MKVNSKVNEIRRFLLRALTQGIGKNIIPPGHLKFSKEMVNRVLIIRPNHKLGNLLLITPLVQEVIDIFPDCKIDLFVKGRLSNELFKGYDTIEKHIQLPKKPFKELLKYIGVWFSLRKEKYDLVINIDSASSSGRLSTFFARGTFKVFDCNDFIIENTDGEYEHFAKRPVYCLRHYLEELGLTIQHTRIYPLDLKLSNAEILNGKKILNSLSDNDSRTICIFTYATGSKCYSEEWWISFYEKLKSRYPDYTIIEILPIENISKIGFQAHYFYSKEVREIASVIANSSIFIGADSGMMHLASASKTTTIGLFHETSIAKYKPYNRGSIGIDTNEVTSDNILKYVHTILSDHKLQERRTGNWLQPVSDEGYGEVNKI